MTFDYVAKPDYSFVYGVEDPELGKSHKHSETREGDVVKGEYSLVEPDGSIRRVVYTSDAKNGFQATVTTTPAEKGWSLPPQPFFYPESDRVDDHVEPVDGHEQVSYPENVSSLPFADDVSTTPREIYNTGEPNADGGEEERLTREYLARLSRQGKKARRYRY